MFKKVFSVFMALLIVAAIAIPAMAAEKLDTPDGLYWDGADETQAVWDEVEDAKQYEVYLYRVSDSGSKTKVGETKTKKTKYDFSRKMTEEGDYCFKVRALAKDKQHSDSSWSEDSENTYASAEYAQWVKDGRKKQDPQTSGPGANKDSGQNNQSGQNGTVTQPSGSTAERAGWRQNETGWWYATNAAGTTWHTNCWQWLDGNQDGIAECYCFGADGYMYASTTTPDGYMVNADGAWTVNGVVQTQAAR